MKRGLITGIGLIMVAGVVIGYFQYNAPRADMAGREPEAEMSATELVEAFVQDEETANERYLGKVVQVRGKVSERMAGDKEYGLLLDGGPSGLVYCSFAAQPEVEEGELVEVKGICSGFLMDVVLNDCVLIKIQTGEK